MTAIPADQDIAEQKRLAAARALDYVHDGMRIGLGTGSTAEAFVELLAERIEDGLNIVATSTSKRTYDKARELGIPLEELDSLGVLDLTVDGADEADRQLSLIKGGGGALLREKIVAASSRQMIVIADESKLVQQLGRFPLPVEVVPFGHTITARRIANVIASCGRVNVTPVLRMKDREPFVTDNGNYIYDCPIGVISDCATLAVALATVPGLVETGLFVGLATHLVIAGPGGVAVYEKK